MVSDSNASYPHPSIDQMLRRLREINHGPPRKVVILGAGISGLVAARELQALGHEVEIYEARDRIGGRILTHHFADGSYNELGAMRIAASHDFTHHYVDQVGLTPKLRPFINSVPENFLDLRGVVCRYNECRDRVFPKYDISPWLRQQENGGAIFGWITQTTIDTLTEGEVASLFAGDTNTDTLRYLANTSLGEYLAQRLSLDARNLVGMFTSLEVWWDKAVTMFLRDNIVGTGDNLTTIHGGVSQLPERLYEGIRCPVHLGRDVISLQRDGETGVQFQWTQTGACENSAQTEHCDYLLCTIPFAVLRRMKLGGFSEDKLHVIRDMAYAAATKVLLNCKERFWQRDYGIFAGGSVSDKIQRQTYYPMDHSTIDVEEPTPQHHGLYSSTVHKGVVRRDHADDCEPGVLIGAYAWGRDGRRLGALPEGERADVVMGHIESFHPEIRDYVVDSATIDWEAEKYSAGAFAFLRPGQLQHLFPLASKPEGRIFFAGEHCSTDQAWIQGSLISTFTAMEQILSCS
ncbi:MAG: flavin monoamine oxidase family protein [Congregibacter sp.]